ncbi:unnamed protein product [Orchesella dallaii]|uniref:Uncharacterized protein n=1 Tax=Orchesella dallaii TaxID=48710 RepID=A0ABP1RYA5_9HEXA
MAIQVLTFRAALLLVFLFVAAVLRGGASLEETKSRVRRHYYWNVKDDQLNDDISSADLSNRYQRQAIGARASTFPPSLSSTTDDPTTSTPFSTTTPDTTPDPNDKCGTYWSTPRGLHDPSPCFPPNSGCANPLCMQDLSPDDLYSCLWSSEGSNQYDWSLFSNSTPPPPLVIEVPGNCQPNNTPPAFINSTEIPTPHCFFHQNSTSFSKNATKCVCPKWDGSCPDEELKYCEKDHLLKIANEQIRKILEISEMVQPGCSCDYELEQMLPLAIQAVDERKNLYRANMLLYQARETHICNRRRLMTCQPDGTCGCAPGTAQREYQGKDIIIRSYYCYATQGNCDDDPANLIKQFKRGVELVRRHYGDPNVPTHKDYESGCFINYCKNAAENIQNRVKSCSN